MRRAEVAVIGGGPAGAAAAIRLAEAGRHVVVLERATAARHKVCGEFLSVEALGALARLGIDPAGLGAVPIDRLRIVAGGRTAAAQLPFAAAGLSRLTLDAALLDRAAAAGAEVRYGARVRSLTSGGRIELSNGHMVEAGTTLLATGKHELPGQRRPTRWRGRDDMIGLKIHLRLPAGRLVRTVALHLFAGGCAGIQPVDGAANLCISLDRRFYAGVGGSLGGLLMAIARADPTFAATIAGAEPLWPKPLATARVPYGHLLRPGAGAVWRLGDQAAVTPSFTGDGLAIALNSGLAAAEAIIAGASRLEYERALRSRAAGQMRVARVLQAVVDRPALHEMALGAAVRMPWLLRLAASGTRLGVNPGPYLPRL